ncbi:MAG: hypothetical protein F6K00_19440 [Leptolyngbya sp. SIOISBB]|nr:hypothetical protein [Leptolyngbya sp. SIOISBB]
MLSELLSPAQVCDRQGRTIAAQLRHEAEARQPAQTSASSLTDADLEFIEFTRNELRSLGSHAALFGEPAEYPKSATYMDAYRRRQNRMVDAGEEPRCPLSHAGGPKPLYWGEHFQCQSDLH